mmetsp:Transcript_4171/g.12536  ORF Transcript_4171/g.12536 Transcript_4171/m.12536 type:complete len:241 (+) Transcript_4171:613-1335(+)
MNHRSHLPAPTQKEPTSSHAPLVLAQSLLSSSGTPGSTRVLKGRRSRLKGAGGVKYVPPANSTIRRAVSRLAMAIWFSHIPSNRLPKTAINMFSRSTTVSTRYNSIIAAASPPLGADSSKQSTLFSPESRTIKNSFLSIEGAASGCRRASQSVPSMVAASARLRNPTAKATTTPKSTARNSAMSPSIAMTILPMAHRRTLTADNKRNHCARESKTIAKGKTSIVLCRRPTKIDASESTSA